MRFLTGGSGLLGTELQKLDRFFAPPSSEVDITKDFGNIGASMVIHAAAYTNVPKAEIEKAECFNVNVWGTLNLLRKFPNTPFVYISTEYAHKPVNFYSLTKSLAEQLVTTHSNYLIIRTLFKPRPWKYDKAFKDQYTQGDYVDKIAPLVLREIENWNGRSKLIYVGTGRKTMLELAQQSKPDVIPNSIDDIKDVKIPKDYL